MSSQKGKVRICILLLVLNLLFIWGNSLMSAEASEYISDRVEELLSCSEEPEQEDEPSLVRKLAHFAEFTCLGLLLSWLAMLLKKKWWLPFPLGVAAGCIDETIQMFVPDRGPGILDVGIDSCGVLMGMVLLYTAYHLNKNKQYNLEDKQ